MSGTLYLVATPIGNLGDLSSRGVQTLQEADFIAAEDTRVSMKLLNHFDIKKPLVSYHEHNRAAAGQAILARLLAGETCALVPSVIPARIWCGCAGKTASRCRPSPAAAPPCALWRCRGCPPGGSPLRDSSLPTKRSGGRP